jgi:hypothetical protein
MLINIVLVLGVFAVIASWVVAVRLISSDKFAGPAATSTPVDSTRRDDVLASTTL